MRLACEAFYSDGCFGVLDSTMYDQFAYDLRLSCEMYDSDEGHYEDYTRKAAYDVDAYERLPSQRGARVRGLSVLRPLRRHSWSTPRWSDACLCSGLCGSDPLASPLGRPMCVVSPCVVVQFGEK